MLKSLEVNPQIMFGTSTNLVAAQTTTGTGVASLSTTLFPAPAGADDVSIYASTAVGVFSGGLLQSLANGLRTAAQGAGALINAGVAFQTTDMEGGADVGSMGSSFQA